MIALVEENCTVCMLCARECPDWCIYIDSHKETLPAPEGGRPRARNMLDRFAIDFSLCMYCGICIEVCPFDALFWSPEFEYAEGDIRNLLHEKDKLAAWAQTVPPPPAHEPNADPPKELAATSRPVRPRPAPSGPAPASEATPAPGPVAGPGPGTSAPGASPPSPGAPASTAESPSAAESPSGPGLPSGPVAGPGPGVSAPGASPSPPPGAPEAPPARRGPSPGRPSRPGTSAGHASVRAIRPPGALPKKNDPSTGGSSVEKLSTGGGDTSPAAAAPEQTPPTDPSGEPEEET